ncbi:hypothetical protein PVAP13_5KG406007 [Panicum virgatum]|uniref:Uncharacterized protein n=1 Tax=Panicum virgatum TaxID=38727 RepID=A0A8T0SJG4_PANVG|nr:hypothetical protein PVAP13_5KG406007 [Panicum virgatum]
MVPEPDLPQRRRLPVRGTRRKIALGQGFNGSRHALYWMERPCVDQMTWLTLSWSKSSHDGIVCGTPFECYNCNLFVGWWNYFSSCWERDQRRKIHTMENLKIIISSDC